MVLGVYRIVGRRRGGDRSLDATIYRVIPTRSGHTLQSAPKQPSTTNQETQPRYEPPVAKARRPCANITSNGACTPVHRVKLAAP